MNYDQLFCDGQEISAFTKDNRIFEGQVYTKKDGSRVCVSGNKWKPLRELQHIRRTGELLYENAIDQFNEIVTSQLGEKGEKFDFEKVDKRGKKDDVINALAGVANTKVQSDQGQSLDPDEAKRTAQLAYDGIEAKAKGEETPGGENQKNNAVIGEFTKALQESEQIFKKNTFMEAVAFRNDHKGENELRQRIKSKFPSVDIDKVMNYNGKKIKESFKDFHPLLKRLIEEEDYDEDEIKQAQKDAADYENEEYESVAPDVKEEILKDAMSHIDDRWEDLEEYILENHELSDSEATDIAIKAMNLYLGNESTDGAFDSQADVVTLDKDRDVEKEFEDAIDEVDSKDNGEILEHLVDKFDIDEGEAEKIAESCNWRFSETVLKLIEHVQLREMAIRRAGILLVKDETGQVINQGSMNDNEFVMKTKRILKRRPGWSIEVIRESKK